MAEEYMVIWLRPDGWWEAGRGWKDRGRAQADAKDQLSANVEWDVVRLKDHDSEEN